MTTKTWPSRVVPSEVIEDVPQQAPVRLLPPSEEVIVPVTLPQEVPTEPIQATPSQFLVGTLLDDRLCLSTPLLVEIEREDEWYVAKCEAFDEFGFGGDPMSAVDDLRQALTELYWTLKEEGRRLAPSLKDTWLRLQDVIVER